MLSVQKVLSAVSYDPATGHFTWKAAISNRVKVGKQTGTIDRSTGYRQVRLFGHMCYEHRLAWFVTYGEWPGVIDHINGDKLDNRISNLRDASHSQNMANRRSKNPLGRGVQRNRSGKRYEARIKIDGRLTYIGAADTAEAAQKLYRDRAKEVFGEFTPSA